MNHEIYLFGSIMRGEVTATSDTDVLVVPLGDQSREEYPKNWAFYSRKSLEDMHREGRLFSWHLYLESKCVYTPGKTPFLVEMGKPNPYEMAIPDIEELAALLNQSVQCLRENTLSQIFEIGVIYVCLRDIAMSASWWLCESPCFSIRVPYEIGVSFPLEFDTYKAAVTARHNSTRGEDKAHNWDLVARKILDVPIMNWVSEVKRSVHEHISQ